MPPAQPLRLRIPSRLRIFRLLRRRCAAGRAQRGGRGRARRVIRTRTRCVRAERGNDGGSFSMRAASATSATARVLVNAAGAWVECVSRASRCGNSRPQNGEAAPAARQGQPHRGAASLRSRPRLYLAGGRPPAWSSPFPSSDDFTLIGTTDRQVRRRPCDGHAVRRGNRLSLRRRERIFPQPRSAPATWCGLMPACARSMMTAPRKAQDVGREYALMLDERPGEAPLLTVYGGKITTYRRLAEDALAKLAHFFPRTRPWTREARCRAATSSMTASRRWSRARMRTLAVPHRRTCAAAARAYGTRVERRAQGLRRGPSISAIRFGADLTAAEVRYLMSKNGRKPPMTCYGGDRNSACA